MVADCSLHYHNESVEVHGPAGNRVPAAVNPVHSHFWTLIDEQLKKATSAIMSVLQRAHRDADEEALRTALKQEEDRIVCFAWLEYIESVDLVSLAARAKELRLPQSAAASVAGAAAGAAAAAASSSSMPQLTGLLPSLVLGGGSGAASSAAVPNAAAAVASALVNGASNAVRSVADSEQRFFERFCEIKSVRRLREHMHRLLLSNAVSARTCAAIVPKTFQHKIVSSFAYLRSGADESDSSVNALVSQDALFEESAEAAERRALLKDQVERLTQADSKLEEMCV